MVRAVIYARYSSENQRETSLQDQERLCRQEAERHGWVVVAVEQDAALSGQLSEDRRPGLQRLMAAAQRREFDALIVDDTSRLSRDTADALNTLRELDFLGIKFVARADGIDTSVNGKGTRLLYAIKSAVGEEFLRDLGEKTHRGIEGNVRRGFSVGGHPYGYRSEATPEGHRLVVHESEAKVVRRIFALRVGDGEPRPLSLRELADRLNREKVPPPGCRWKGRTVRQTSSWCASAVRGILLNPIYTGRVVWNRTTWIRHPDTRRRLRRSRPADDWVERRDESLRIVPQDLWDRATSRMVAARLASGTPQWRLKNRAKFILSGFLRCAVCGGNLVISNRYSYRCATSRDRGSHACANALSINRKRLEAAVIAALRERLYTPETVTQLVADVRAELLTLAREHRQRAGEVGDAKTLHRVEQEIENIKAAIRMGKATETLVEMLAEAEARRKVLQNGAKAAGDTEGRLARALENLPALVERSIADLQTVLAAQQIDTGKEILALLIEGIILHPTKKGPEVELRGNLQGLLKLQAPGKRPGPECKTGGSGGRI
jgi:site-specific DNA recombinase